MEPEETALWEAHPFILKYIYWVLALYVCFGVIFILAIFVNLLVWVGIIGVIALLVPLLIQILRWKSIFYKISKKRIIIRYGLINLTTKNIMCDKIENFTVKRTIVDRIFNTGDIYIYTDQTGKAEGILTDIPKINHVEEILTELLAEDSSSN